MKVGILTLYYKNNNYGGQLQAYALQKFLEDRSIQCEQISFQKTDNKINQYKKRKLSMMKLIKNRIWRMCNIVVYIKAKERWRNFEKFSNSIPHSKYIYTSQNITDSINSYDTFVCGSDQIWSDKWSDREEQLVYCLDFVDGKKKIAYAASIGANELNSEHADLLKKSLEKFNSISVRESSAKILIDEIISKDIKTVLDPTLLLSANDWNNVCVETKKSKEEPYIFAYLLGMNRQQREAVTDIAKELKLKLWTIPYVFGSMRTCDLGFGDIKDYSSGPAEFIGLIKNADLILTDSFHAMVFSVIYHKQFYVFKRDSDNNPKSMNSRIVDFLTELGLKKRLVNSNFIESIDIKSNIDYKEVDEVLEKKREISIEFLNKALNTN